MSKSTRKGNGKHRPAPQQQMARPQATAQTPIPVPLGLIQQISAYINASTGQVGPAMQIINALQQAVDQAGYGRQQVMQPPQEQQEG
jgi:hypothetical protein